MTARALFFALVLAALCWLVIGLLLGELIRIVWP